MKKYWFLLVVAVILFVAVGKWPDAYYQFVHWAAFVTGAYAAYLNHQSGRVGWAWVFAIAAILFNPIAPIYFTRQTWEILDVAAGLLFLIFPFIGGRLALASLIEV